MTDWSTNYIVQKCKEYYQKPGNSVGGNLHIVLDDGNLENSHIQHCKETCIKEHDHDGSKICTLLLQCTDAQRRSIYNSYRCYAF